MDRIPNMMHEHEVEINSFVSPPGGKGQLIYEAPVSLSVFTGEWIRCGLLALTCLPISIALAMYGAPVMLLLMVWPCWKAGKILWVARSIRYRIYQRQIEIQTGILDDHIRRIWIWRIRGVDYDASTWEKVTGSPEIAVIAEIPDVDSASGSKNIKLPILPLRGTKGDPKRGIKKFSSKQLMKAFADELQTAAQEQRQQIRNFLNT